MRKISFFMLLTALAVIGSCKDKSVEPAATATVTPAGTATPNYPYMIEHPDNWVIGSSDNTMVALTALKAWEEGKMDESATYFADSVTLQFDRMDTKVSNDSLKAFLTKIWDKSIRIHMQDFESVISKDKTDEWVTLWYRESWVKNGVRDSADIINNIKLKEGKIILLDNYVRRLH